MNKGNKTTLESVIVILLIIIMTINQIPVPKISKAEEIDEYLGNIGRYILRFDYALIVNPKENHRPANFEMNQWMGPQTSLGRITPLEGGEFRLEYPQYIPIVEYEPRVSVWVGGTDVINQYSQGSGYEYPDYLRNFRTEKDGQEVIREMNPGIDRPISEIDVNKLQNHFITGTLNTNSEGKIPDKDVRVIRNRNQYDMRYSAKTGEDYRSKQFPTLVNYKMDVTVSLDSSNEIDFTTIGNMKKISDKFRDKYKGNATAIEYQSAKDALMNEFMENRGYLYEPFEDILNVSLPNATVPEQLIENLLVESAEDMKDRISIHEIIIPNLIRIDNVRSVEIEEKLEEVKKKWELEELDKLTIDNPEVYGETSTQIPEGLEEELTKYIFYDFEYVINPTLSHDEDDYVKSYVDEDGYLEKDFAFRGSKISDIYEPINLEPKNIHFGENDSIDDDGNLVKRDNWHIRGPKEKLKASEKVSMGDISKFNAQTYMESDMKNYENGINREFKLKPLGLYEQGVSNQGGELVLDGKDLTPYEPYPSESIHHSERTIVPKVTSPPNIIMGMPVDIIGYMPANPKSEQERLRPGIPGAIDVKPESGDKEVEVTFNYYIRDGYEGTEIVNYKSAKEQNEIKKGQDSMIQINYACHNCDENEIIYFEPSRLYYLDSNKTETIPADIFVNFELTDNPITIENNSKSKIKENHSYKVLEKITIPRKDIFEKYVYPESVIDLQELVELDEKQRGTIEISNTPALDYLIEPEGRILYEYLDLTSFKKENTQEGSAQDKEGKKFGHIEGEYKVREGWMGTKEIFNQYLKLVQPNYGLTSEIVRDTLNLDVIGVYYIDTECVSYEEVDGEITDICNEYLQEPVYQYKAYLNEYRIQGEDSTVMSNTFNGKTFRGSGIMTPYTLWAHRAELRMQHHAAFSKARAGLYDFSNRNNKATKSGYGVIQESSALMQTDWPRSGEVRSRLIRSSNSERLSQNEDERDLASPGISIDVMQSRTSTPNRRHKQVPLEYSIDSTNRYNRDMYWKSKNYGQKGNEPSNIIPFDKVNEDLKYKIEWSSSRGEHYANSKTNIGEVVPAFGPTRQHFIHLDHPNGNYNVESWVAVDFGEKFFNVMFAAPLSIPIKGNMFDDSFTTVE